MLNNEDNFAQMIETSLLELGSKEAIHYKLENGKEMSFSGNDVLDQINQTAELLLNLGLKKGDRVLIASKVSPYYFISIIGAVKAGIVPMLVDHAVSSSELQEMMELGEVKSVLGMDFFIKKIPEQYLNLIPIIDITYGVRLSENSVNKVSDKLPPTTNVHPEVALLLFSSGTTSKRKGVEITHISEVLSLKDVARNTNCTNYRSPTLAVLPFSHIAGLSVALGHIYFKSTLFMLENVTALKIANAFQEYDLRYVTLIPKIYEGFMNKAIESIKSKNKLISAFLFKCMKANLFMRKKYGINLFKGILKPIRKKMFGKNLVYLCSGGTALPKETMDFYTSLGYTLVNVYASTETSVNMVSTDLKHYDSSVTGKAMNNYIDIKLINIDENGVGELVVKSPALFYGYFKDEKTTKESYTDDGYFKTGDLAKISADKHITIVGRRKEAILLQNGEKISPDLVESSYSKIMGEHKYAVCGVQLNKANEYDTVFMFIEGDFNEKEKADIKQKLFFENGQIPENYRVSEVRFIKDLPKTSVGKIQRFQLKDIALNYSDDIDTVSTVSKAMIEEDDSIEGRVRNCIRECSNLDLSQVDIKNEMNLYNDLGYDSLKLYQLSIALEKAFKKDLSEFFTAELTVQDIFNALESQKQKKVELEYTYNVHDYPLKRGSKDEKMFLRMGKLFRMLYKTEYIGWKNVPKDKAVIFCPNHTSELDPLVLCFGISTSYRKNLFCICWDKFTATKKGRYFMKLLNAIPIDRRSIGNPAATLKVGTEYLNNNKSLVIFPEGTRTYDGSLGAFQNGAACIAQVCDVPIIPVTMIGMYDAFAKTKKRYNLFKNGKRIRIKIVFGKPIYGNGLTTNEFTEKVKQEINRTLSK
ncbi:MAG: AMP-binding protein [Clostridia bacterium]|nr:AMP-binding protein [Clostridia bacterium]